MAAAAVGNVEVIPGNGALGQPRSAPYGRIIATIGTVEVPSAWLDQLTPTGRLVVPLRLRGTSSRSVIFERHIGGWRSQGSQLAVFMPLRGIADDARRTVALTPGNDVTLKGQAVDGLALTGALDTTRYQNGGPLPAGGAIRVAGTVAVPAARQRPHAHERPATGQRPLPGHPMFPWGSMATTRGHDLPTSPPASLPARKGVCRTRDDLADELADVIITTAVAMSAITDGGVDQARSHFERRLETVTTPAGATSRLGDVGGVMSVVGRTVVLTSGARLAGGGRGERVDQHC